MSHSMTNVGGLDKAGQFLERIFDVCLLGARGAQAPLEFFEVDIVGCT